jgi:asparagine synthetase B (glutamine-hydrolysing)
VGVVLAVERLRYPARARFPWLAPWRAEAVLDTDQRRAREGAALHPEPLFRSACMGLSHAPDTPLVLAVSDRLAARSGLEMRHPFLDVRVVEALLSLPSEQRFSAGLAKAVLRRAMRGTLPELVRKRRDPATFDVYVERCVLDRHRPLLRGLLRGGRLEAEGLIDAAWVAARLDGSSGGGAQALFRMAAMELWLRGGVEGSP